MAFAGGPSADQDSQRAPLHAAFKRTMLPLEQLWTRYFALGGDAGALELEAYFQGLMALPALQRDILAQAINERLDEVVGRQRAPYSRVIREPRPSEGPLAALLDLLEGTHAAPPERLPQISAAAGHALGVELVIYLVDYDQRELRRVSSPAGMSDERPGPDFPGLDAAGSDALSPPSLGIDSTLAGRAFRQVEMVASTSEETPRLWVPLVDGIERLGVLEVILASAPDLHDPVLREQLTWVSHLLGHLVTIQQPYGDAIDAVRRRRPRTPGAELIWSLLPPLTAGIDGFTVTGTVEPAYEVGGDAFDYALSQTRVTLAIFDAMGHALGAGLIAAAALGAYRSARRNGLTLFDQSQAIDEALSMHLPDDVFLTGVLAEIDLSTGRMRYIAAGHPHPLVLRGGRVVRRLENGRRVPFGISVRGLEIGETTLEPHDWVVLYTDGITEARDAHGAFFGEARLIDFLERESASGQGLSEIARRVTQAVLRHQNDVLQDDATVLIARWETPGARDMI